MRMYEYITLAQQILDANRLQADDEVIRRANQRRILSAQNSQRSTATEQPRDSNCRHIFINLRLLPESPVTNTCCCEQIVEYRLCDHVDGFCESIS